MALLDRLNILKQWQAGQEFIKRNRAGEYGFDKEVEAPNMLGDASMHAIRSSQNNIETGRPSVNENLDKLIATRLPQNVIQDAESRAPQEYKANPFWLAVAKAIDSVTSSIPSGTASVDFSERRNQPTPTATPTLQPTATPTPSPTPLPTAIPTPTEEPDGRGFLERLFPSGQMSGEQRVNFDVAELPEVLGQAATPTPTMEPAPDPTATPTPTPEPQPKSMTEQYGDWFTELEPKQEKTARPKEVDPEFANAVREVAEQYKLPENLFYGMAFKESGIRNVAQPDGLGRGYFQIDLGQRPHITEQQALDPRFAAEEFARSMTTRMSQVNPSTGLPYTLRQAVASWNVGPYTENSIISPYYGIPISQVAKKYSDDVLNYATGVNWFE